MLVFISLSFGYLIGKWIYSSVSEEKGLMGQ